MSARRPKASEHMVHQPKITSEYDHIPSHVKAVMMEPRHNRVIFRKAAEQFAQLQALASALNEEDRQALAAQYPDASALLGGGSASAPASPRIGSHMASAIGAGAAVKLPSIASAEPSPRAIQHGRQLFAPTPSFEPEQPRMVRPPRPPRGQTTRPARPRDLRRGFGEAPSFSAYAGGGVPDAGASMPRLDDLEAPMPSYASGYQPPPPPVLSPGGGSEIGGGVSFDSAAEGIAEDGLWEKNPAILAPALVLRTQPIPLLVTRREQALDGLRGVLHSLSRVRHSSHRLPSYVSKSYQARLQHAVGWYRVTTTELIERLNFERQQHNPKLMRTPWGELRHVHDPYVVDGANVLLVMGRVDLAFAPLPAASDPLLLLWFSQHSRDWVSEGGVPEALLAPTAMHSLLELARMQKAHELLLNEAEIYGLSPLPLPYEPRDNELGVTCELLLYGMTGIYQHVAKAFRLQLEAVYRTSKAARMIERMLRGWIVRAGIKAYKAALKVQKIYRKWKAKQKRREQARLAQERAREGARSPGSGGLYDRVNANPAVNRSAAATTSFERASRILMRGKSGAVGGEGGGGGGGKPGLGGMLAALVDASKAADRQQAQLSKASVVHGQMQGAAGPAIDPEFSARVNRIAAQQARGEQPDAGSEDEVLASMAVKIQARMRTHAAQKEVYNLAEASEAIIDTFRNTRGAEAVASVTKAYRARNAFSMLLLKAFKQRQMAIVMQGSDETAARVAGVSEPAWRMAVEAVRERCMQGLLPAEEELQTKVKQHLEFVSLQGQFDKATARLQFWEALKLGTLPPHLSTLTALGESQAIERAQAYVDALIAQRALPLPAGLSAKLHVSKLVGAVKALQDLTEAMGVVMHELGPLERQLRSHLAHMGVPDPHSQEAPPPVSSNAGRAMLATQASQNRTSAVMQSNGPPPKKMPAVRSGADPTAPASEPPSPTSVGGGRGGGGARRRGSIGFDDDVVGGGPERAPGEALEEAISAAQSELGKLEVVREVLGELRAETTPPRYMPKLARDAEMRREALADLIRRVHDVESQHEHLSHFCAQARGSLDLLEAADAFDYRRQRRRLRGQYAQLGILSMQSLRAESDVRRLRDRGVVIEAMRNYLEETLPNAEKAARERIEATATLTLAMPPEVIAADDQLQQTLVDDVEEYLAVCGERQGFHGQRVKLVSVANAGGDNAKVAIAVLEGAGKSVDEMLNDLSRAKPDQLKLDATRKLMMSAPQHVARPETVTTLARLGLLGVVCVPAHTIVHDSRTLADRKRELEAKLADEKAELRPLQTKEMKSSAAQAQLWKLEGVEEVLSQCQNPRLLQMKDNARSDKGRLLQLARDSEAHLSNYSTAQRRVLELEAWVEALSRLMTAAHAEGVSAAFAPAESQGGKGSGASRSKVDNKGYSANASREVAQNILREKRLQEKQLAQRVADQDESKPKAASRETAQRKYKCQGALQLLKTLHSEDKQKSTAQPPPTPPSVRLIALSRFLRRTDALQREAIKMMARESARLAAKSTPVTKAAQEEKAANSGHWAQMKAMIQMAPRKSLIDETIFDEKAVERAALEMEVDLSTAGNVVGNEGTPGVASLPLVLYFMRAPLPYPFKEMLSATDAERFKPGYGGVGALSGGGGGSKAGLGGSSGMAPKMAKKEAVVPPDPKYRNVLSDVIEHKHPLRHVYSRLARRAEKITFKRHTPNPQSPEAWMEFVEASGTPYYYCFLTKQCEYEFPQLLPVGQLGVATKTAEATHAMRFKKQKLKDSKRRLSPASLEAMRMNMEAEQKSKPRRAAMLNKMPLPVSHIVFTAQYLGIDTFTQSHLMWLASAALCDTLSATLPVGWELRKIRPDPMKPNDPPPVLPHYYYNTALAISQWEHPSLTHWRSVLCELQAFEKQSLSTYDTAHHGGGAMTKVYDGRGGEPPKPMLWVTERPDSSSGS